jgi:hypothetical protein
MVAVVRCVIGFVVMDMIRGRECDENMRFLVLEESDSL